MSAEGLCRLRILVTRPAGQCEALCRRIAEHGGEGIPWPAIEIEPLRPEARTREQLARAGDEDLVIFVSRNAVAHGAALLPRSPRPRLAAIGPSTRNALEQIGLNLDIEPDGFDSESLLAHRQLTALEGHRVFIVRGAGGRELLGDTLRERGATHVRLRRQTLHGVTLLGMAEHHVDDRGERRVLECVQPPHRALVVNAELSEDADKAFVHECRRHCPGTCASAPGFLEHRAE